TQDAHTKKKLKELVALAHSSLVKKIARSLARRSNDPVEDIVQVGSIGLLKAIDLFDPSQGTSFKTYATYLITGEIRHYLRDKVSAIRAPREIKELSYRVHKLTLELAEKLGEAPTNEEIARELQMPSEKIAEVRNLERRTTAISFDTSAFGESEDNFKFEDKIADTNYTELIARFENRLVLDEAIEKLDEESRTVINLSFFEELNQREISEKLGISQMQVSRKIKKALNKLFEIITEKGMSRYEL
ncbi:RNA polymerase sigma-B factor, partial [Candidatus Gastranaerophilus sp. (ex Termes propinquus)]